MNKIRVSILTQPLGHNYGGLLQAFALQTYLKKIGCDVETLDRRSENSGRFSAKTHILSVIRLILGRIKSIPTEHRQTLIHSKLADFRDRRLVMSPRVSSEQELRDYYTKNKFDVFLVGSDQVWRPQYSPSILNFYLDFVDDIDSSAKRIAYAASFGVDEWEYASELTYECKKLAKKFDAISVRENSAIELCWTNLGVAAQWVVDPTLLLSQDDYELLTNECDENPNAGCVLSYILDPALAKSSIVNEVSRLVEAKVFSIKPEYTYTQVRHKDFDKCRFPSVEKWLQAFRDASYVVTDSFHGTVFAILFNKPFIAVVNLKRGRARFESLLSQFGLLDRLVEDANCVSREVIEGEIDWNLVNSTRESLAGAGRQFLLTQLSEFE